MSLEGATRLSFELKVILLLNSALLLTYNVLDIYSGLTISGESHRTVSTERNFPSMNIDNSVKEN